MKKILIPLYYYHPYVSGLSIYAKRLAEGLAAAGYQVTVLTTQYDKGLQTKEIINGVMVIRCPVLLTIGKGLISPHFLWKSIILGRENDVVNFQLPLPDAGIASLFIPAQKIYATYHCDVNLGQNLLNRIIQKISYQLMFICLHKAKKVLSLSINYLTASRANRFLAKTIEVSPPVSTDFFKRSLDTTQLKKNWVLVRMPS